MKSVPLYQIKEMITIKKILILANKIIDLTSRYKLPSREKYNIMQDFYLANKICPLNFDLLGKQEKILIYDYIGIYNNLDRKNIRFENGFFPFSAWN